MSKIQTLLLHSCNKPVRSVLMLFFIPGLQMKKLRSGRLRDLPRSHAAR